MRTRAVSIKHDRYDHYIGRPGKGLRPVLELHNRYTLAEYTRPESIRLFAHDFLRACLARDAFNKGVLGLKGSTLGCHCHGFGWDTWSWQRAHPGLSPLCHGDVIAMYIENGWPDGTWWLSTPRMTFEAVIQSGQVIGSALIARRFIDQRAGNLIKWLRSHGELRFEMMGRS